MLEIKYWGGGCHSSYSPGPIYWLLWIIQWIIYFSWKFLMPETRLIVCVKGSLNLSNEPPKEKNHSLSFNSLLAENSQIWNSQVETRRKLDCVQKSWFPGKPLPAPELTFSNHSQDIINLHTFIHFSLKSQYLSIDWWNHIFYVHNQSKVWRNNSI